MKVECLANGGLEAEGGDSTDCRRPTGHRQSRSGTFSSPSGGTASTWSADLHPAPARGGSDTRAAFRVLLGERPAGPTVGPSELE